MMIYYVTRWGNDDEGINEADTNFIVLASDYKDAAEVVDERLIQVGNSKAAKFCQRITELGFTHADIDRAKIILGPAVEHALYHDDVGIPDNKKWVRDNVEEGWVEFLEYYE